MVVASIVVRTAVDALLAKASALAAGFHVLENTTSEDEQRCYRQLLDETLQACSPSPYSSQQSPLVNAGYAMRIAAMAHSVRQFMQHHVGRSSSQPRIRLVVLGCGWDVLGLWTASFGKGCGNVDLVEVDTGEICRAKRQVLLDKGWVMADAKPEPDIGQQLVLKGTVAVAHTSTCSGNNYSLVAADLRDPASLELGLQQAGVMQEDQYPTLVLLELVLAYLDPVECDNLLAWCAAHVLSSSLSSALVALEPMGNSTQTPSNNHGLHAYQLQYVQQFQSKLHRGQHTAPSDQPTSMMLHPLGTSLEHVQRRLRETCGFAHVHASHLGTSAAWACQRQTARLPPDLQWDEHAALSLHLASYVHVVATTTSTGRRSTCFLRRQLCPWAFAEEMTMTIQTRPSTNDCQNQEQSKEVRLTCLEWEHQGAIRELFEQTYRDLAQEHVAVRKMVKSALRQDLSTGTNTATAGDYSDSCAIRHHYQTCNGDFFVALADDAHDSHSLVVVGGIGIRQWMHDGKSNPCEDSMTTTTFEIHRLFVHPLYQRQGIGRALLERAERVVERKRRQRRGPYRIVATTSATTQLCESANRLYTSSGYTILEERGISGGSSSKDGRLLVLRTFVKQL